MQISMFDGEKPYKINKPIRLIELFAGIGAQAKALQNIGADFEHYRICEFDKYAVQSYNAIHGTKFETSDITKITATDLGINDTNKYEYIMTYSFPCQDLSLAGKQAGMTKGSGTRSGLLWEVERLLDECEELPQVLLMENVPQVHGTKNEKNFYKWIEKLESLGYRNYWQDLNAKDYGIPQNRNRTFMVSLLGNYYYDFPKPFPLKLKLGDMKLRYIELEQYTKTYFGNKYIFDGRLCKAFKMKMAKLDGDIACCITARSAGSANTQYITRDNGEVTIIDIKEVFSVFGFSDKDFYAAQSAGVSNSQLYKQAGNSIVVKVLEAILKQMTAKVEEEK